MQLPNITIKDVVSRLLKSGLQEVSQEEYQALSINAWYIRNHKKITRSQSERG